MAGVPCEGTPNFWVNADGSYREEGQKNDRGCIWDKVIIVEMHVSFFPVWFFFFFFILLTMTHYSLITLLQRGTKFACAILSLPIPSNPVTFSDEGDTVNKDRLHQKTTLRKFLLVGSVNSGACTIFKQVGCFLILERTQFFMHLCCIDMHALPNDLGRNK